MYLKFRFFLSANRDRLLIVTILFIALFFRTYKGSQLQYYSFDDEMHTMVLRRIAIDKKLVLVTPNPTLNISLGSFWHLLSAPLLYLADFRPQRLLLFGSFLGVLTTFMVYLTGKELGSKPVGLIASFLYASSFDMSLADRRWWPLSLNPLLVTLSVFSISKMVKGKLGYAALLAISMSFAWHADPTLIIISVAAAISFIVFRLPLICKQYLIAIFMLLISLMPFLIFELRHRGAISYQIKEVTSRIQLSTQAKPVPVRFSDINIGLTHSLFSTPSQLAEEYLYPHIGSKGPQVDIFASLLSFILFIFPFYMLLKDYGEQRKKSLIILYIFVGATLAGIVIANLVFKFTIYQYYFTVVWPILFLLSGYTLAWLITKTQIIAVAVASVIFATNIIALVKSSMRYPLNTKVRAANFIASYVSGQPFSLQILGGDIHLGGGGLGGILALKGLFPWNRDYYIYDWLYRAYSLYNVPVDESSSKFEKRIFVYPSTFKPNWTDYQLATPSATFKTGSIAIAVFNQQFQ